jgi:dienelactone hydrolase
MAQSWRAKGYVVVFVDYLAARGKERCPGITVADIAEDVLAVASYLQTQSFIDPARISAIGWSTGGSAVLAALAHTGLGEKSSLHAVVAYSPGCSTLHPWTVKVPVLVLMGANDGAELREGCQGFLLRLPPGIPRETHVYPDAGHVFNLGGDGYNAAATAAAAQEVDQFMKRAN